MFCQGLRNMKIVALQNPCKGHVIDHQKLRRCSRRRQTIFLRIEDIWYSKFTQCCAIWGHWLGPERSTENFISLAGLDVVWLSIISGLRLVVSITLGVYMVLYSFFHFLRFQSSTFCSGLSVVSSIPFLIHADTVPSVQAKADFKVYLYLLLTPHFLTESWYSGTLTSLVPWVLS